MKGGTMNKNMSRSLPISLLYTPFSIRAALVSGSFLICLALYILIFPLVHNCVVVGVPIVLAAWFFGYRGMVFYLAATIAGLMIVDVLVLRVAFWMMPVLLVATTCLGTTIIVGFLVALLRSTLDTIQTIQREALYAEQQKMLALQQQQEAQKAEQVQRDLNVLKDQFLMNVSHELRTPLTVISGYLALLKDFQDTLESSRRAFFVQHAIESCTELQQLVDTILDVMTAENDVLPLRPEALLLAQAVEDALNQVAPESIRKHIVQQDVPDTLVVWADHHHLQQIIQNLLSNALKYSPGQTLVTIHATQQNDDIKNSRDTTNTTNTTNTTIQNTRAQVCLTVKDSGSGIPAEEIPLLFGKFVRLKRDMAGPVRGTGLGLYISRRLTEAMGGRIWVESSGIEGEGSCFFLTLPAPLPD
jgi:signal transduction histidine kinase